MKSATGWQQLTAFESEVFDSFWKNVLMLECLLWNLCTAFLYRWADSLKRLFKVIQTMRSTFLHSASDQLQSAFGEIVSYLHIFSVCLYIQPSQHVKNKHMLQYFCYTSKSTRITSVPCLSRLYVRSFTRAHDVLPLIRVYTYSTCMKSTVQVALLAELHNISAVNVLLVCNWMITRSQKQQHKTWLRLLFWQWVMLLSLDIH